MNPKPLSPAAYLDLKIQLDKVAALQVQCVEALGRLMDGKVSRDDYMGLLDRQATAQRAWQKLHEKYFAARPGDRAGYPASGTAAPSADQAGAS